MLSKTAQDVMDGEENEQMGVGEDWVCFDLEKEYVGEEDEGERVEQQLGPIWFQDLKEWTKLDIAGASQLATDRERW